MIACLRNTGLILVSLLCPILIHGQQQELTGIGSDPNHRLGSIPTFFNKEHVKGSPYLTDGWLRGNAELADGRQLPEPGKVGYFNFDKMTGRLYRTDGISKIWNYPSDSVRSFTLGDSNAVLSFVKDALISRTHFLQVMVRSEKGYTVYREWITKLIRSEFRDAGYYTTGQRFDEYVDVFNYYIVYPGHRKCRRLDLKVRAIYKALPGERSRLDSFFSEKSGSVDLNTFVLLMQYINEKRND
jgi:hypothetical protein